MDYRFVLRFWGVEYLVAIKHVVFIFLDFFVKDFKHNLPVSILLEEFY